MIFLCLLYAVIRYCNDLAFFMAISFALLVLFLAYDADMSHNKSIISNITRTEDVKEILAETHLKTLDAIDEGHSSFLMVYTPETSQNDISVGGFRCLRAQSIKTVQALIENRRFMTHKSAVIRARKERIKRSNVAFQSRRPNF